MGLEILFWTIIGVVAGSLARVAMPGPRAGGIKVGILVGLVGAFIGGAVGTTITALAVNPVTSHELLAAATGAMILLFLFRATAMRWE